MRHFVRRTIAVLLGVAIFGLAPPAAPQALFSRTLDVGPDASDFVLGDLNGDGRLDLFVISSFANAGTLRLGNGDGTFRQPVAFDVGQRPRDVVVVDLNTDGNLDIVATSDFLDDRVRFTDDVSVLLGVGNGTFLPPRFVEVGYLPREIVVGNVTPDGIPDLVVANSNGVLTRLLGMGNGTFERLVPFVVGGQNVQLADMNGDGMDDLVFKTRIGGDLEIRLGNGDGTFQDPFVTPLTAARRVLIGDFDDDAVLDVVVSRSSFALGDSIWLYRGNGDGTLRAREELGVRGRVEVAADLDGRGGLDLLANTGGGDLRVALLGTGDGTFEPSVLNFFGTSTGPTAVADIDQDGIPDLVALDLLRDEVELGFGLGDGDYAAPTVYAALPNPVALTIAPLDDDASPDLGFISSDLLEDGTIGVLPNRGMRRFGEAIESGPGRAQAIAIADFNGDENVDVASADGPLDEVGLAIGDGRGSFRRRRGVPVGRSPAAIVAGDFDADGNYDVATADLASRQVSVLLGNGNERFSTAVAYPVGSDPQALVSADFDGDGAADLAVANTGSQDVSVLLGGADGRFQDSVETAAGGSPLGLQTGDVDGDGVLDLVTANADPTGTVSVLRGNGDGTFQPGVALDARSLAADLALADFDLDGRLDLVTLNAFAGIVSVLLGNGDATFREPESVGLGGLLTSVEAGDLDGDGLPDVAVSDHGGGSVTVLWNLPALPPPPQRIELVIQPFRPRPEVRPLRQGLLRVALLGAADFDTRDIDLTRVAFGPAGALALAPEWPTRRDVNGDGFLDLITRHRTQDTGIALGDRQACLTGELIDGSRFEGCGPVITQPACGLGLELVLLLPPLAAWHRRGLRTRGG